MNNKLFVAFNEVANDATKTKNSVKSTIKGLITDEKVRINEKHIKGYDVSNCANMLFFSNEAIPLFDEYLAGFNGCGRFNQAMHSKTWSFCYSCYEKAVFNYLITIILLNT